MQEKKYGYLLGGVLIGLAVMYFMAPSRNMEQKNLTLNQEAENKALVTQFEDLTFNQRNVDVAAELLSDNFKQHNPTIPDGVQGFKDGVGGYLLKQNPNLKLETKRIIADGDLVMVHKSGKFDSTNAAEMGVAVIDIFRVANGKIVEHWDVIQVIPAESANMNTMF